MPGMSEYDANKKVMGVRVIRRLAQRGTWVYLTVSFRGAIAYSTAASSVRLWPSY